MRVAESYLEELRVMSSSDLVDKFEFTGDMKRRMSTLRKAVEPEYYHIISNNELTLAEMSEQTGLDVRTIARDRHVLAQAGLSETKYKFQNRMKDGVFLKGITKPMSLKQMANKFEVDLKYAQSKAAKLYREGQLDKLVLHSKRSSRVFRIRDLIGNVPRAIYYRPGQEKAVANFVHSAIMEANGNKKISTYKQRALTNYLKHNLPFEIFKIVYKRYAKK